MLIHIKRAFALLALVSSVAYAQVPPDELAGDPTRILVLGTPHLASADNIAPEDLTLLLQKLAAFQPEVIAIESVSGEDCESLRNFALVYPGVAETYCTDPTEVREALGLSAGEAALSLVTALDEFPDTPSFADHRRLATLFWATGDRWSAALQWSYLPEAERIPAEEVSEELAKGLDQTLSSQNENRQIAAALALRLGLQRLHQIDDHSADSIQVFANPDLPKLLQDIWGRDIGEEIELQEQAKKLLGSPDGLVAYYRFVNSPRYQAMVDDADFGAAAASEEYDKAGREYVAWWHTRNLRMAANVLAAAGNSPGARVLVLTGTSHKAYLDNILGQFRDVKLVDVDDVLAP